MNFHYLIGTIIYGIPLNNDKTNKHSSLLKITLDKLEIEGFHSYYSHITPDHHGAAFGVQLDEIDSSSRHYELSKLKTEPTKEDIKDYERIWNNLSLKLQKEVKNYGEPRVFILWSIN